MKIASCEIVIAAPIEVVWEHLTTSEGLVRWVGPEAVADPVAGGELRWTHPDGATVIGRFVELVPHWRLVFTYGWEDGRMGVRPESSTVEVDLADEDGATRLRLTHHGLPPAAAEEHERDWTHFLAVLREQVAVVRVDRYGGSRDELRSLFELAEDSAQRLDGYIDEGRVLVAVDRDRVVGHLQLTETGDPSELEVKNMAVLPSHQGRGVGVVLIAAAVGLARDESRSTLVVATAAADTGNLRFYQRLGFRMRSVERDAFTEAAGYEPGAQVNGIELRDRVWLDRPVAG